MYPRIRPLTVAQANLRALLLGGVLVLAGAAATAAVVVNRDPPTDGVGCLAEGPPPSTIAVVLDGTTAFSPSEAAQAKAIVRDARDRLPRFGRLILLRLDPDHPYQPDERLAVCNPGSPRQLNLFFHTPSKVERRWREHLEEPVNAAVDDLAKPKAERASPILETVTGLTWRRDFGPAVPNRELVLVSDLRQYTENLSFYRPGDLGAKLAASPASGLVTANLAHARIRLEVLHRPVPDLPEAALQAFWQGWLTGRGADHVMVDGVAGTQGTRAAS